jgi:hypothetical protein
MTVLHNLILLLTFILSSLLPLLISNLLFLLFFTNYTLACSHFITTLCTLFLCITSPILLIMHLLLLLATYFFSCRPRINLSPAQTSQSVFNGLSKFLYLFYLS